MLACLAEAIRRLEYVNIRPGRPHSKLAVVIAFWQLDTWLRMVRSTTADTAPNGRSDTQR